MEKFNMVSFSSIFNFREFTDTSKISHNERLVLMTKNGVKKVIVIPNFLSDFYDADLTKITYFLFLKYAKIDIPDDKDLILLSESSYKQFKSKPPILGYSKDGKLCISMKKTFISRCKELGLQTGSQSEIIQLISQNNSFQTKLKESKNDENALLLKNMGGFLSLKKAHLENKILSRLNKLKSLEQKHFSFEKDRTNIKNNTKGFLRRVTKLTISNYRYLLGSFFDPRPSDYYRTSCQPLLQEIKRISIYMESVAHREKDLDQKFNDRPLTDDVFLNYSTLINSLNLS